MTSLPGIETSRVTFLPLVDSTNTYLKNAALNGAAEGSVVIAREQTGGRGRLGRSFHSPEGAGIYMSMLFRPRRNAGESMTFTAHAAVAVCRAVKDVCGITPGIKWPNDLVLQGRKICGILTESVLEKDLVAQIVLGIGLNVNNSVFPQDISATAGSLFTVTGRETNCSELAAAMVRRLDEMYSLWQKDHRAYLADYRALCLNPGREALLLRGDKSVNVTVLSVDDDFALLVRREDGSVETVSAGEVSIRGIDGYI